MTTDFKSKSFKRPKLSDSVFEEFLTMLRDGRLEPGQRLPAERELAESFGVSRATVRDAVQRLALLGYLDVRQGDGTVVTSPDETAIARPFRSLLLAEPHLVWDLLEFRRMLEPEAARFAAQRRSDDDLATLDASLERQAALVVRGASLASEDEVFHRTIIGAAHNAVVVRVLETMRVLLSTLRTNVLAGADPELTLRHHTAVVEAIHAGDDSGAYDAMTTHLDWVVSTARRIQAENDAVERDGVDSDVTEPEATLVSEV